MRPVTSVFDRGTRSCPLQGEPSLARRTLGKNQTLMSSSCDCLFCASPPCDSLPAPVLIVHPERTFSFWVWMTSFRPMKLYLTVTDSRFGKYSKPTRSLREAVLFAAKLCGVHVAVSEISSFQMMVKWSTEGGLQSIGALEHVLRDAAPGVLPMVSGESCLCRQFLQVPGSASHQPPTMPRRSARTPPKRKMWTEEGHEAKRISPASRAPRRVPLALRPSSVPSDTVANDVAMQDANSCQSSPDGGSSVEVGTPYDLLQSGGCAEEIREILRSRPVWDEETIEELLRWGARPKLHSVYDIHDNGRYKRVRCTFVHPEGVLVRNVWLPFSILMSEYTRQTRHLR